MSLEPNLLTEYKKDKPPTKWFVYFSDDTGDIVTVSNREQESYKNPYLMTDSDDARKILMGTVDPKKFAVVEVNQELKLVTKSAVIRIKEAEDKLTQIPINQKVQADVNIVLYVNSWKMEVNFNQDTLYRMTGKRFFRNISVNPDGEYDMISLYLIKKNDPNTLLKQIDIDPAELIEEGYMLFDLAVVRRMCSLSDISILTRKIFSSYRIKKQAVFTGADYVSSLTKRRTFITPTAAHKDITSTFTLSETDGRFFLKSNFTDPADEKIYTDIEIYVTDINNPNRLLGMLNIPKADVGWQSTVELDTRLNLTGCGFLCKENHRNITFEYKEGNQP